MSGELTTLDASGYIGSLFRVPRIPHVPLVPAPRGRVFLLDVDADVSVGIPPTG